jgi:hypothetical protein
MKRSYICFLISIKITVMITISRLALILVLIVSLTSTLAQSDPKANAIVKRCLDAMEVWKITTIAIISNGIQVENCVGTMDR